MVVISPQSLGQGESMKKIVIDFFFAITIRRVRTFYTYKKKPTTDMYILNVLV